MADSALADVTIVGRYTVHAELAAGGMARVYLGRLLGPVGFSRTVAIKRLHRALAADPEFVAMFLDEARLASRIRHSNVVPTLDVVAVGDEASIVMDYVHGESLSQLLRRLEHRHELMAPAVAVSVLVGTLRGLHAAHEATSEDHAPLGIVHRDVSPPNILVGVDGIARVADFGIAKATSRLSSTSHGQLKGKLPYMAPEQIEGRLVDRRADIWAAAATLWEALTGKRLFGGTGAEEVMSRVLLGAIPPPSSVCSVPPQLDAVVMRGLVRDPAGRFATAEEMADALERALAPATAGQVASWLSKVARERLDARAALLASVERAHSGTSSSVSSASSASASSASSHEEPTGVVGGRPPERPAPNASPTSEETPSTSAAVPLASRAPLITVAVVLFAALVVAAAFMVLRREPATEPAPTSPPAAAVPPMATNVASSANAPLPTIDDPAPSVATAASTAAGSVTAVDASHGAPPATRAPRRPAAVPAANACDPPYTLGPPPDYIRRPKLECLKR